MKNAPDCNCPMRLKATVRVTIPSRFGDREIYMCPKCAQVWEANDAPAPAPKEIPGFQGFSEEWLRSRVDSNAAGLAAAIEQWLSVDTTDIHAVSTVASMLCMYSRNISAYAGDLAQIASRKAWGAR